MPIRQWHSRARKLNSDRHHDRTTGQESTTRKHEPARTCQPYEPARRQMSSSTRGASHVQQGAAAQHHARCAPSRTSKSYPMVPAAAHRPGGEQCGRQGQELWSQPDPMPAERPYASRSTHSSATPPHCRRRWPPDQDPTPTRLRLRDPKRHVGGRRCPAAAAAMRALPGGTRRRKERGRRR
jgi:hypothetical protein